MAQTHTTPSAPELRLVELRAARVPDSIPVSTIAILPDSSLVVSSRSRRGVSLLRGSEWQWVGRDVVEAPVGVAVVQGGRVIEIFDAARRAVVRLLPTGGALSSEPVALPGAIQHAVRAAEGWYVGTRDSTGSFLVFRRETGGGVSQVYRLAPSEDAGRSPAEGQLAAFGDDVVVTRVQAPFTSVRISRTGRELARWTLRPDAAGEESEGARWFPMPAVPLDNGALQTLTDLRSDLRVISLFGADGRLLRSRVVDAPFGIVAGVPEQRLLLGSRWVGGREIVVYGWAWAGR